VFRRANIPNRTRKSKPRKFPSAMVHWENPVAVYGRGPQGQGYRIGLDVHHARQEIGRAIGHVEDMTPACALIVSHIKRL